MRVQMMDQTRTCYIRWPTLAVIASVAGLFGDPGLSATRTDSPPSLGTDRPPLGLTATQPTPDPSLSAVDVVRIQMRALQTNGATDQGIRITFGFASPSNKRVTGPFERFAQMIKSPPYDAMLNAQAVEFGALQMSDGRAMQEVLVATADGETAAYLFMLRRQTEAPVEGCWMTEAVIFRQQQPDDHFKSGPPGLG
jgi:hypothetical protein